ncbi:MmcB family DNA repair protein (plasmid) [Bacillus sp. S3]|uniref:MmcB family DNA repair protein n=1 Tax=Bacillus sp. S3 TaxID=486398 RepID=UPI00118B8A03|nr:MmcB family DNA repair protein [Bacillus sp. S3]QCJ45508.1 MmcB family DNA repair protein [Bacillus sp. S3]
MAAINGTDNISLAVMNALKSGAKVKDIPIEFGISIDQAKRLSRLLNFIAKADENISKEAFERLRQLGTKALVLYPLSKQDDWEGLNDILLSIPLEITRDKLTLQIAGLEEKRDRIKEFQIEVDNRIFRLEKQNETLKEQQANLRHLQAQIEEQAAFLCKYDEPVRIFLIEHLGLTKNGQLSLAKRLDYYWQKNLQKKGIIHFNKPPEAYRMEYHDWMEKNKEIAYTYTILDLDALAEELPIRWKRGWDCTWNYDKEAKRNENNKFSSWSTPTNPYYNNTEEIAGNLKGEIERIGELLSKIEEEKEEIQNEIAKLRKTSPKSFMEQVEASNKLSPRELKRHGELQNLALKWLYHKGYTCSAEFSLNSGKRVDVIGYNESGHIIVIEVKASRNDYVSDNKWTEYLNYCDEFYFLLDHSYWYKDKDVGLLKSHGKGLVIEYPCNLPCKAENKKQTIFSISRSLSKKLVFGY